MRHKGILKEHSGILSGLLRVLDILLIGLAAVISYRLHYGLWFLDLRHLYALTIGALLVAVLFPALGFYRPWRGESLLRELRILFLGWIAVSLGVAGIGMLTPIQHVDLSGWIVIWFFWGAAFLILFRVGLRLTLYWVRRHGFNQRQIVLVGGGPLLGEVVRRLEASKWTGLTISAVFYDEEFTSSEDLPTQTKNRPRTLNELEPFLEKNPVDQVWLTMPLYQDKIRSILHSLRHSTADIRLIPDLFGFRLINHSLTEVAGLPVLNLTTSPMSGGNRIVKEVEDRLLAAVFLIGAMPLMIAIALAIKVTSRGPIFYRQARVGWNGKVFTMLKFRTMKANAEAAEIRWGGAQDKAVTTVGRALRKSSLDELPQLINVLKGDMSLVGPRPERPQFVSRFKEEIPDYMKKHMVKAGITGWAQVNGWRGDTDLNARIEHDLYYIEHWSLSFDIKIIVLTIIGGSLRNNAE